MKPILRQISFASFILLAYPFVFSGASVMSTVDGSGDESVSSSPNPQANFTASGHVTITLREADSGRTRTAAVSGVTITFTRTPGKGRVPPPVQTDSDGNWSQSGFPLTEINATTGNKRFIQYRATPGKQSLAFNPSSVTFDFSPSRAIADLNFNASTNFFLASGRVTNSFSQGVPAVTMAFERVSGTGAVPSSVQTDNAGGWNQRGFEPGTTYSVTPRRDGFHFTPRLSVISITTNNLVFQIRNNLTITGSVFKDNGLDGQLHRSLPVNDVAITFDVVAGRGALPQEVRTDRNGKWTQTGFFEGTTYRAQPSLEGLNFEPATVVFSIPADDINFKATESPVFAVLGQVLSADSPTLGVGLRGVTLSFERLSDSGPVPAKVQTVDNGLWAQGNFIRRTEYRVTPSKPGFTFSPRSRTFSGRTTGLDFQASRSSSGSSQ
jgi:hypothetical protein